MEKVSTVTRSCTDHIHTFFCDGCGKELGSSEEYDDGYYYEHGEYEKHFCVDSTWYRLHGHYCDDCAAKKTDDILSALKALGFVKE